MRLVPAALATWLCAGTSVLQPAAATGVALSCAVIAVALLALARRGGRALSAPRGALMSSSMARAPAVSARGAALLDSCAATLAWGAASLALGAASLALGAAAAAHVALAAPERAALTTFAGAEGRAVTLDAIVVGKVEPSGRGWGFDAVVQRASNGESSRSFTSPVSIRTDERPRQVDLGASITVSGSAVPTRAGARSVLAVQATGPVAVREEATGLLGAASRLREGLQGLTAALPQPAAGLIAGLSVGDTSAVSAELDAAMKAASLSHLTAVSGANCALVVAIAYGVVALCGGRRGLRIGAGAVALTGFVVLVSPEPSVVRAATMAAVAMWGLLLGRRGVGISVLSATVVIVLILDPWLATSLGFALSTVATASLLLIAGPLADGLTTWMPAPIALALSVPLAAQLACGPLLVLIEPSVPLYGVLANLVAAPAAPIGTVLGLLACVFAGVPFLSDGLAALAWLPAAWIAETAQVASALPGNAMPWLEGAAGLLTLAVLGASLTLSIAPARGRSTLRAAALLVLAGGIGAVLALGPLGDLVDRLRVPADWSIAVCDVGQGDAVLIRSAGRIALVDSGPDPAALRACLDRFAVDRVELLVLTHFDLDHRGGAEAVLDRTDTVLHGPVDDAVAHAQIDAFVRHGARVQSVGAGDTGILGAAAWQVLWPPPGTRGYTGNDASVVVEFSGGGVPRIVLLGDLSAAPQASLASSVTGDYAVVKVAHHGSADQSADLYRRIAAPVALITVGENTYGHPRRETLDLLTSGRALIVRTDQTGAAALSVRGDTVRIWRERNVRGAR